MSEQNLRCVLAERPTGWVEARHFRFERAPKAVETLVVTVAAGAVGRVVGQLAKAKGCRVVGVAGGEPKCRYVVQELGFDACVDCKAGDLIANLQAALPRGIALCGMITDYNATDPFRMKNVRAVLINRLMMQGFIVSDHRDQWPVAMQELCRLLAAGELKYRETVAQGLESAPEAFIGLLQGRNLGKQLVKLV